MDKIIIELYKKCELNQTTNYMDSKYWIFDVKNIILKENGVSKRYLKVLFFNRFLNEKDNLMRLTLKNGDNVLQQDYFVASEDYNNASIMGFAVEIDLIDDSTDIEILEYVIDGKVVHLNGQRIKGCKFESNETALNAISLYRKSMDEAIVFPHFDEEKWICVCGYCNGKNDLICPVCARKKELVEEIYRTDIKKLVLENLMTHIELKSNERLETTLQTYINLLKNKYNIGEEEFYESIDYNELKQKHYKLIDDIIEEYIKQNKFVYVNDMTFQECLDAYCDKITNSAISKETVLKKLNIEEMKNSYEESKEIKKLKSKSKKNKITILIACVGLLFCAVIVYGFYKKTNSFLEGRELIYNKDYLEKTCNFDNVSFKQDGFKASALENNYCNIVTLDEKVPSRTSVTKDGKEYLALDDEYFLVKEKKQISENQKKVVHYIVNEQEDIISDNSEIDYYLETYENEKLVKREFYVGSSLSDVLDYTYKDDGTVSAVHNINGYKEIYTYKNGVLINNYTESSDHKKFWNVEFIYSDNGTLLKLNSYQNGNYNDIIITNIFENNKIVKSGSSNSYYDNNGLLVKVVNYDENSSLISEYPYFYNFEDGTYTIVGYKPNGKGFELFSLETYRLAFFPSLLTIEDSLSNIALIPISY